MSSNESFDKLSERLLKRFKDVPTVDKEDVEAWIETAMNEHGYEIDDYVPTKLFPLILLYAEADGTSQIALRTAYYFSFVDKDESIDKSMVSTRYRMLAETLWKRYKDKKIESVEEFGGSRISYMKRVDRP